MPQELNLKEAIRVALETEKEAMDFYTKAASIIKNERGKKIFLQLAKEEREHASEFYNIYPGSDIGSLRSSCSNRKTSGRRWSRRWKRP